MYKRRKKVYGLGGDLGGIIGGALGSMIVPGIGTAIGSALGSAAGNGLQGAISNNGKQNQQATDLPTNQITYANDSYNKNINTMNPYGNSIGYAAGGQLQPLPMTNYNGNSHENGGIPLGNTHNEVEGGEVRVDNFIFSDRIKMPGSQETFADIAKKLEKKYAGKTDNVSRNAMERELKQLATLQEKIKQRMGIADGDNQDQQQQDQDEQQQDQGQQQPQGQDQQQPQDAQAMQQSQGQPQAMQQPDMQGQPQINPAMMAQMQQGALPQQQPPQEQMQQHAYGGNIDNPPHGWFNRNVINGNWKAGDYGKYYYSRVPDDRKQNVIDAFKEGDPNFQNFVSPNSWAGRQFASSYRVGSYGDPFTNSGNALTFNVKIPINSKMRKKNGRGYTREPVQFGVNPAYFVMPGKGNNEGNFYQKHFAGQYLPNLFHTSPRFLPFLGHDKNNIGRYFGTPTKRTMNKRESRQVINSMYSDLRNGMYPLKKKDNEINKFAFGGTGVDLNALNNKIDPNNTIADTSIANANADNANYFNNNNSPFQSDTKNQFRLTDKQLNDLKELGKTGLSTLGGSYDVARGLKGGDFEFYRRLPDIQLNKLNPNDAINEINNQTAYGRTKIGNIAGQGVGQYLNNVNALQTAGSRNIAQTYSKYDNANTGIINKQRAYNSGLDTQNIKLDMNQNAINAKERDVASNDIQHGLTTISQGFNTMYGDKSKQNVQDYTIRKLIDTGNYTYLPDGQGGYIITSKTNNAKYKIKGSSVYDLNNKYLGTTSQVFGGQ